MRNLGILVAIGLTAAGQVSFRPSPGQIEVWLGGQHFSNLYYGDKWAKPFLHPLRSLSGIPVTRGYPVEEIEGEIKDHTWHHGLWWAHGDINGVDFWRDLGPEKTGRIVVRSRPRTARDALELSAELVTPQKQVLGSVLERFRFERRGANHLVDAFISVRADRGIPLKLGDTEEGTFAIRLADEFRLERGVTMTNSNGQSGRDIWGKRARWVDYSTTIRGQAVGVIVLDHPANPKHPTYWHARHYGLCSANPFGERDFEKDKTRDGSVGVPAGGKLDFRYRVIIHPGRLNEIDPEALFQEFAREVKP